MKILQANHALGMLRAVAQRIIDNKPLLTKIDSDIGDGDHGIGMELGMQKALQKLDQMESETDVSKLFMSFGKAMLMSMGGASGVLFGSLFLSGAKALGPKESLSCADFAQMMNASLQEIKRRGGAEVGDKTMVDALEPAVNAMNAYNGDSVSEMLALAAQAAKHGAESTKDYIAKFGRAKSLMARAIGHEDAGAVSTSLIFSAMSDYASKV